MTDNLDIRTPHAMLITERLIETAGQAVLDILRGAPLAKPGPSVTALPQVDDVLTVKQPGSEWDVPREDPERNPTP